MSDTSINVTEENLNKFVKKCIKTMKKFSEEYFDKAIDLPNY